MKKKTKTIGVTRLFWSLLLGLGLAAVLLLALVPHQQAQAQGPEPDVNVNKWDTGGYARPGGVYVYEIHYRNDWGASATATDTIIVDTLPTSTTYAGDTSGLTPIVGPNGVITWYVGDLAPGDGGAFMVTLNVSSTVPTGTGIIAQNCAFITSTVASDSNPDDNYECAGSVDVWDDDVEIHVDKWPNPGDPTPGQEFAYSINTCNNRGAAAGPVWLTDTLPLSTTFVSWSSQFGDTTYWTEVITTDGQVVLYAPGLAGDVCEELYLRLLLDTDASISTTLENTVVITTPGDVDSGNNQQTNTDAHISDPRYDMGVGKNVNGGIFVPGGWVDYHINYNNQGNSAANAWLTDTLPEGTYYLPGNARWQEDGPPFTPTITTSEYLVWDLGMVGVGDGSGLDVQFEISSTVSAGTIITNCVTVGIAETESTPLDNESCIATTIYTAGLPNLHVQKWSDWHGDGEIGYNIYFANYGDVSVSNVRLTDTFPISTTSYPWEHWPNAPGHLTITVTSNYTDDQWLFLIEELGPGDSGWINFNVTLDDPGAPIRWYTNTVEITTLPSDTNPADNTDTDVAFSGGEVNSVHLWVNDSYVELGVPQMPVTITTAYTQVVWWWTEDNLPDSVLPGDIVTVAAGAGTQPVVIQIPDPFDAVADSDTDTVWGQIDALDQEWVQVHPENVSSPQNVQTDSSGHYTATFSDIPRGVGGEVRYNTEIDYADVTFHRSIQALDLILSVNYGHDWVDGNYEPGHTGWITVTESDGTTIKATIEITTAAWPWWGGFSGFSTNHHSWSPNQPDIQAGDWVFGLVDNGQATQVHVGSITGTVDVVSDSISGRIYASWFTQTLDVRCDEWAGVGAPGKSSTAGPDGDPPYYCEWDPGSEWDVQPGEDIGVWYVGPDLNQVANGFREPQPYVRVSKSANGNPAEGGNFVFNIQYWNDGGDGDDAANVVITDTLMGGMAYLTDTSGFSAITGTLPGGEYIAWNLGTLSGGSGGDFDLFVKITAVESNPVTNTVQITTSSPYNQSDPSELYSEWNGTVQANDTRLNVDKWIDGPNPAPGTDFDWAVNICNDGSTASSELTMTDTLPISTTLLEWWGQNPGWTEVLSTSDELVVSYPSIPGWWCGEVYLRFHLDENAWIGMQISNTATISASNDMTDTDNTTTGWAWINGPYSNLYVRKDWLQGQLVPGGELYYGVQYGNDGNAPADNVWLTYTLPVSTTFNSAWWNDQYGQHPFTPDTVTANYVVWDLGTLENGSDSNVEIMLNVDGGASPGAVFTSTVEITPHPTDYHYDDNATTWVETLNSTGPNLEVHKQNYWWNGTGQIQYEMRIKNRGTERLEPVWITDTYPISTTWDGNWWYGHGPWITTTHDVTNSQIIFWLEALDPGETASINFQVDLDGAIVDTQGLFFTNTLEAPIPGDVYPADNYDQVIAYAGPDVYAEKWLSGGEPHPGEIVTFTVKFGNRSRWQGMDGGYRSHITDTLPAEMEFITATAPYDPNQRWTPEEITGTTSVRWHAWTLWPDYARYFDIVARITDTVQSGDVITNVIEIHDDNPNDVDLSPDNDVFELPVTILDPVFEVGKVYESSQVAGMPVTYTLTVTNTGNYPGTNVVLSDTVPAYLENVSSGGTLLFDWLWWQLGPIAPYTGTDTAQFNATLPCTASLSIINDSYLVIASTEGVTSPLGAEVRFDTISPTIGAAFNRTLGTILAGDTVLFTNTSSTDGTALGYQWDFGDGSAIATTQDASHTYARQGSYTAVLTTTDTCGYSDVAATTVVVGPRFGITKTWAGNGVAGTAVTYTLTVTNLGSDVATVIVSDTVPDYLSDHSGTAGFPYVGWQLGPIAPNGGTDTAQFDATITCTAGLDIVNDDYGVRWSDEGAVGPEGDAVSFTASAPAINAAFTHTPGSIVTGDTVYFTATAGSDGTGLSYEWDFGDVPPMSGGLTSTHVYAQDGSYTVAFTATDTCGYSDVATATVTVIPGCIPVTSINFAYAPPNPVIQSPVVFTATATPANADTPIAYAWDLGDDNTGSNRVLGHTYALSDTYTVIVTATNCSGTSMVTHTEDVVVILTDGAQTPIDPTLGGTMIYTDSQGYTTTVEVPGGSVTEAITLLYTPISSPTQPISPNLRFANHTFDLDAYLGNSLLPDFVFSEPVTITIHYSDSDVMGIDESSLRLYYWTGSAWDDVVNTCTPPSTYTHNLTQNVLGVPVCHLTRMGVMGTSLLENIYLPLVMRNS